MYSRSMVEEKASVLRAAQIIVQRQSGLLTDTECLAVLEALEVWGPGMKYDKGQKITDLGQPYEVRQQVEKSILGQAPHDAGMLAVYRPIPFDDTAGTRENPIPFVVGLDCRRGLYYSYEGKVYLCDGDLIPCTENWKPGTPGMWQWKLQN